MLREYMKRSRIILLASILFVSILLLVIFRKKIENFATRGNRNKREDKDDDENKNRDRDKSSNKVKFYTEKRYKGVKSNDIGPGKYTSADMVTNGISKKTKSFISRGNIQIRLYPQDNFGGSPSVYTSSKPSLDVDFDVKSIIVLEGKNTVYIDSSTSITSSSAIPSPTAQLSTSSSLPQATLITRQPETPQPTVIPATSVSESSRYVLLQNTLPSRSIIPASYISTL